jgi:predicted metallo-beta-lactamase superfamily hydrolase
MSMIFLQKKYRNNLLKTAIIYKNKSLFIKNFTKKIHKKDGEKSKFLPSFFF